MSEPNMDARRARIAIALAEGKSRQEIMTSEDITRVTLWSDIKALMGEFSAGNRERFGEFVQAQVELAINQYEATITGEIPPDVSNALTSIMGRIARLTGSDAPTRAVVGHVSSGTDLRFKAAVAGLSETQMEEVYLFAQRLPRDYKPQPLDATFFPTTARKELL